MDIHENTHWQRFGTFVYLFLVALISRVALRSDYLIGEYYCCETIEIRSNHVVIDSNFNLIELKTCFLGVSKQLNVEKPDEQVQEVDQCHVEWIDGC